MSTITVFSLVLALGAVSAGAGAPAVEVFRADFSRDAGRWETQGGRWHVARGGYHVAEAEGRDAVAYAPQAPLSDRQTIEATLVVQQRLHRRDWAFAGVALLFDNTTFWFLGLTEGPTGAHYLDFLEKYRGRWQAQSSGNTKLRQTQAENMHLNWKYGVAYRVQLKLDPQGITARVADAKTGRLLSRARYEFGRTEALRMGTLGLVARGCAATFSEVTATAPARSANRTGVTIRQGRRGNIAVLRDPGLPGFDPDLIHPLTVRLRKAGYGVTYLSAEQACDPTLLQPRNFFLYVIPGARVYPARGATALMSYLRRRGQLLVLGGPAFTRPVWRYRNQWVDKSVIRRRVSHERASRVFLDFEGRIPLSDWRRNTNDPSIRSELSVEAGGPGGTGHCLRYFTAALTGWNTYTAPPLPRMFPAGHELLCFWAKGDAHTPQLSVEVDEKDGARWIAVIPLGTKWKHYVLAPDDFLYWKDSPAGSTRGGAGDRLHPAKATHLVLGLAQTHTAAVGGGPHTFWVDDFGTAPNPVADYRSGPTPTFVPLETLTPAYKVYPLSRPAAVKPMPGQALIPDDLRFPAPAAVVCPIARPRGQGFQQGNKWRWIPLVQALDKNGGARGTVMWLLLNNAFPYRGSMVAAVGTADPRFVKEPAVVACLTGLVNRLRRGLFFCNAGAREFSWWPGESVHLGAEVVDLGPQRGQATVRFRVTESRSGRQLVLHEAPLRVDPGRTATVTFSLPSQTWPPAVYRVRVELLQGGQVVDEIAHEFAVLSDVPAPADDYVTVKGSDFLLHGAQWYPVGVNFWPLYVSGSEPGDYSLGWLSPGFYQPDEVEADLNRMEVLGINMVSIQLGRPDNIRNLLDFLRRCRRHHIRVNGFLATASPLKFDEAGTRDFLQRARLVANSTLFAYDIIWEPGNWVFRGTARHRWDADWERWLKERYGSVKNAETDWNFLARRAKGRVTSPSDRQLRVDGPWRVMVAAYRRFMDDLMSRKWNAAVRKLRALDPRHLVSFRQGNTLPQDFTLTATPKHIDFICPEGYAVPLGENGYDVSGFLTRYVHFTTGGKPIVWAEFGRSVWDRSTRRSVEAAIRTQAEYHDQFYRMVLEAGANGTAPWWWPGGYRVNERSDFGITNPDGTPRPAAELIRRYAARMKTPRPWPRPQVWLTIDCDAHPGGYWYLAFHGGKDAYRKARKQGKALGIRTAGTGTDSTDCPLVAVGGTPYTGRNPPKYLNAEFNELKVEDLAGRWVEATSGARIVVPRNKPVRCRASVGNTQEATWLTPTSAGTKAGAVYLASTRASELAVSRPLPADTPPLADAEFGEWTLTTGIAAATVVEVQLTARNRAWFGEKRRFTLAPAR